MHHEVDLESVVEIQHGERDYMLDLHSKAWEPALAGWQSRAVSLGKVPSRILRWNAKDEPERELFRRLEGSSPGAFDYSIGIEECILRFPSAPIYGIRQSPDYLVGLEEQVNLHSFRVLRAQPDSYNPVRASRIFLFHNGLNELRDLSLFYKLAAALIAQDRQAVCLIRPFPGHLTRHPFLADYAETPLDRYLADPNDLFRQWLRYLIETQWMLTVLAPLTSYRLVAGLNLLGEGQRESEGRAATDGHTANAAAASAIHSAWKMAYDFSKTSGAGGGRELDLDDVRTCVDQLRSLIDWSPPQSLYLEEGPSPEAPVTPTIHAIGYSLGGFVAQSEFFTWPFAVASCTTLCSGGPMRDLALTAFAHTEEWKTVVNALPHRMAAAFLDDKLLYSRSAGMFCGLPLRTFACLYRIFQDVFLREATGPYATRLSEFVARLLFVVGGKDPIVSVDAVLRSGPSEGVNLLELANLSHFPLRDENWRSYWLFETARLVSSFARRAESRVRRVLYLNWTDSAKTTYKRSEEKSPEEDAPLPSQSNAVYDPTTGNEELPSVAYQAALSEILDAMKSDAKRTPPPALLVVRNSIPFALFGLNALRCPQGVPHYSERLIHMYFDGLRKRGEDLKNLNDKVTIVVPFYAETAFTREQGALPGMAVGALYRISTDVDRRFAWDCLERDWRASGAIRLCDPEAQASTKLGTSLRDSVSRELATSAQPHMSPLNTLPDVWVSFSAKFVRDVLVPDSECRESVWKAIISFATTLSQFDLKSREWKHAQGVLESWLRNGSIRIVKVSGAEHSPRFMGYRIYKATFARRLIIHSALCLEQSRQW